MHSGRYAWLLDADDDATVMSYNRVANVVGGQPQAFSAWTNIPTTTDSFTLHLIVQWRDAANRIIGGSEGGRFTAATNGWVRSAVVVTPPAATTNATVLLYAKSLKAQAAVDDVFLGNLVLNGGFERDANTDGTPDSWRRDLHMPRVAAAAHTGSAGVRYSGTDTTIAWTGQRVSVTGGQRVSAAAWLRIPPTTDRFMARLEVVWLTSGNRRISASTIRSYYQATTGWTQARGEVVAPNDAATALVRVVVSGLNGTLDVDDVAFWP